jgi:hypothetical protein
MADEAKTDARPGTPIKAAAPLTGEEEHYEEVSEYRIGEGAPPLFLVVVFFFIVTWACFSWIPLFGY